MGKYEFESQYWNLLILKELQKIFGDMYIGVKRTIETDHFSEWQILEKCSNGCLGIWRVII